MTAAVDADVVPYVGLRPYHADDTLFFFGRGEQTAELLEILHRTRFLPVIGSSGSGKSSLVRAGLIPKLLGGFLVQGREEWRIATLRPGGAPTDNLAAAVAEALGDASGRAAADAIRERHTDGLLDYLGARLGPGENVLLLVDQFEEIFAYRGAGADPDDGAGDAAGRHERARRRAESAEFVDLLLDAAARRALPLYVVLTMRTDFLGDCDVFYGLPEAMNAARYLVPRLSRAQLREAVEGPAALLGARVAPRLVDRLLNELGDRPDRLPLLEHALRRTWERWEGEGRIGPLDLAHLDAVGGLEDALANDAERALEGLDVDVVGRVFRALTDTDVQGRRVRRPARVREIVAETGISADDVHHVVKRFGEASGRSFLVVTEDGAQMEGERSDPRVDITHESLIRQWGRLRAWVDEERDRRDTFRELAARAARHGRGAAELLRGHDLAAAERWWHGARPNDAWSRRYAADGVLAAVDAYVRGSASADAARVEAERVRRRDVRLGVVAAFVALAGLAGWAMRERTNARTEARTARAFGAKAARAETVAVRQAELITIEKAHAVTEKLRADTAASRERAAADTARALAGRAQTEATLGTVQELRRTDPTLAALVANELPVTNDLAAASVDILRQLTEDRLAMAELRFRDGLLELSPDGALVAARDVLSGVVKLWRADGRGAPVALSGVSGPVDVAFAPGGELVAGLGADGVVQLWPLTGGRPGPVRTRPTGARNAVLGPFSRDGSRLAILRDTSVVVVPVRDDAAPRELLACPPNRRGGRAVARVDFSPDGRTLLALCTDNIARLLSTVGGQTESLPKLSESAEPLRVSAIPYLAVFDPGDSGGRTLATLTNRQLSVWRRDGGGRWSKSRISPAADSAMSLAYTARGLLWTAEPGGTIVVHNERESRESTTVRVGYGNKFGARLDAGGTRMLVVSNASLEVVSARIYPIGPDATTRAQVPYAYRAPGELPLVRLSPDGRALLAWRRFDDSVWIARLDGSAPAVTLSVPLRGGPASPAIAPGGTRLAFVRGDSLHVIAVPAPGTGRAPPAYHAPLPFRHGVRALRFSRDGRFLAVAASPSVLLWSEGERAQPTLLTYSLWTPVEMSFDADGTRLLALETAAHGAVVSAWRLEGRSPPARLSNVDRGLRPDGLYTTGLEQIAWSPDGRWKMEMFIGGSEIRIVPSDGRGLPIRLKGLAADARLIDAVFRDGGAGVVAVWSDGSVRDWSLRPIELQRILRSQTSLCLTVEQRRTLLGESVDAATRGHDACERRNGRLAGPTPRSSVR